MIRESFYFLAGSIFTAAGLLIFKWVIHDKSINSTTTDNVVESLRKSNEKENLDKEMLSRIYAFFGENRMEKIRKSFVIVVGAGGVGSHCSLHLLRSGVGSIRIIDFDQVTLSSLNRHATASRSDVGVPKVIAMKKTFQKISPSTKVDARTVLLNESNVSELLSGKPDFVVDCIDNIGTKISLLKFCCENNIKVISSMGSACKSDPTKIEMCDISKTHEDKLAKAVRYRLKKCGISKGIPVVFSTERTSVEIMPLSDEIDSDPKDYAPLPDFRVRILPVLGPLPAIFGAALASYVLNKISEE